MSENPPTTSVKVLEQEPERPPRTDLSISRHGSGALMTAGESDANCSVCAAAAHDDALSQVAPRPSYVYAIGRIEPRFPRLSVEKEFAQVIGRSDTAGQTDAQVFHSVLSRSENRHLARLVCWVLTVREIETYLLRPIDAMDIDLLLDAIRPQPHPLDLDVVIGTMGPIAPPDLCNGLMVPMVVFDQVYSFDRDALITAIPRPAEMTDDGFDAASARVLDVILRATDNAGSTDEHRALNYLAMRYSEIYRSTAEHFDADFSLSGVDVVRSALGGGRTVMDCVFSFTNRRAAYVEKVAVSVDTTDEFPFLVGPLSPYFDRTGAR